jgi:xanthine dehydrogenase accessory factor/xanthine dehydrogenase large subunit
MTDAIAARLRAVLAEGRPAAIVTVTDAKGSTPREAGALMLVTAGEIRGSIGGGQLELRIIAQAREFLNARSPPMTVKMALGPELGQCCGGHVGITIARANADTLAEIEAREHAAGEARPTVLVFGAGHVGRALARALGPLPFRVRWIDERQDEFGHNPPAGNVEIIITPRCDEEVRRAPAQAAYVVLTHSHSLDGTIVAAVLERGDFAYCGLIGSLTKRSVFERAFRETGIPDATIARLTCPIGDRGIDDKRPEIIAALVAAELIEVFAGKSSR